MPKNDSYGLAVSSSGAAFKAWRKGFQASLSFDASGIPELSQAVELDPNFALAHAMLARQQVIHGMRQLGHQSLATALQLLTHTNARETSQIEITANAMRNEASALPLALEHLTQWPLDVFVFGQIVGPFGLFAFSGRQDWQQECLNLLEQYSKKFPSDDWWFLSSQAFALAETGNLQIAERVAEQAWEIAHNGTCAHSLSHVHFEQCALHEGIAFIDHWITKHEGARSDMRHHLMWHQALFNMELGNTSSKSMTQLYLQELDPKVSDPLPLSTYSDNASLLWHCALNEFSMPQQFHQTTHAYGQQHFAQPGFPFADMHTIVITALLEDDQLIEQLTLNLEQIEDQNNRRLLSTLLAGVSAFVKGKYSESAETLKTILVDSICLGGSNPQRRIVEETYLQACLRANKKDAAISVLCQRLQSRASPFDSRLLERLEIANTAGDST